MIEEGVDPIDVMDQEDYLFKTLKQHAIQVMARNDLSKQSYYKMTLVDIDLGSLMAAKISDVYSSKRDLDQAGGVYKGMSV